MIAIVARSCLVIVAASLFVALYRVLRGPTLPDRVAAADLLTTCAMAVVAIAQILAGTRAYIDIVMAMAVLGFFGTVVFAKYLLGGRPIG